jgi:signal transduction histidine kinase
MNSLEQLFSAEKFMPHGSCYMWDQSLIWLHVISDGFIIVAYYSIPITLIYFVRRRKDLQFNWIFVCFALFIVACGTTHLMEIWNIWHPTYWLSGTIKGVTALASVFTAIALVRLVPQALALPSPQILRETNDYLHKEMEQRQRAEEEVQKLNIALERHVAQLEAFSSSVSHDLRAPLRHVVGFVELLQREAGSSLSVKSLGHMKTISQSAKRMGDLIDDLLAFSQIGRSEVKKTEVNLDELVRETLGDFQAETTGREIVWTINALPVVRADRALLRLVLVNLISNALKFTGARTEARIEIGCAPVGNDDTVIFIRDNGDGFDPKYTDKLFGVFQRLHSEEEFEGTGIGLANVHRIIRGHGGRTWAEGVVDGGAAFYFSLPKQNGAINGQ